MEIVKMPCSISVATYILYSSRAVDIRFGQIFRVPETVNVSATCALLMHTKSPWGTAYS